MAMDALRNLTNNIPDWQRQLDELSGQIRRRQAELAAVAAAEAKGADSKSLRNIGSTESLKPKDEGPLHFSPEADLIAPAVSALLENGTALPKKPSTPPQDAQPPALNGGSGSPTRAQKQTRESMAAAHSRAAAQVKNKKNRSASVVSAEGIQPYRTRSMIIVYYDSKVQSFFDELVRFVSSSRNLMRKAKMAAKVAHIKRLAELEYPDDDNTSGDDRSGIEALPSLKFMSTRRFGGPTMGKPGFGGPGLNDKPDVYDTLDKFLESVQMTCEHGAHQFLRDADCDDELKKIQKRMAEVLDLAAKEMERVEREEPELAKETGDANRIRTMRPISIRRDIPLTKTPVL